MAKLLHIENFHKESFDLIQIAGFILRFLCITVTNEVLPHKKRETFSN